jgi:hypothetical protein
MNAFWKSLGAALAGGALTALAQKAADPKASWKSVGMTAGVTAVAVAAAHVAESPWGPKVQAVAGIASAFDLPGAKIAAGMLATEPPK